MSLIFELSANMQLAFSDDEGLNDKDAGKNCLPKGCENNMSYGSMQENMYWNAGSIATDNQTSISTDREYDNYIPTILTVDVYKLQNNRDQYKKYSRDEVSDKAASDNNDKEAEGNKVQYKTAAENEISNLPAVRKDFSKSDVSYQGNDIPKKVEGISDLIKRKFAGAGITEFFANGLDITGEVVFNSEEIPAIKSGDTIHFINTAYIASFR